MAKVVMKKNSKGKAKVAKTQTKSASKGKAKLVAKKPQKSSMAAASSKMKASKTPAKAVATAKSTATKPAAMKPAAVKAAKAVAAPVAAAKPAPAGKATKGVPTKAAEAVAKGGKLSKADKKAEALAQLLAAQAKEETEVVLTNADGKQYCRVHDCDNEATTDGHCRFHYLALWKRNKVKAKILQNGKLDKYIEDLTSKYPDKYLEMLRKDLASEKDFNVIVAEMDVEDSGDEAEQEEDANRFIEEVRGGMPSTDDDESGY